MNDALTGSPDRKDVHASAPAPGEKRTGWLKPVLVVLALGGFILAGRSFDLGGRLEALRAWIASLGGWGPLGFVLFYVLVTVLAVPGSLITMAAGAIFGLVWGTAYAFAGALGGSVAAFLIARYAARDLVERRLADSARLAALDRALGREGLKIIILLRLSPVFPFNVLNYGLGLTQARLRDYTLASFAMLPGGLLYVYYGRAAGDVAKLASGTAAADKGWGYYLLLGFGLLATIAATAVITRIARRAFAEATATSAGTDEQPKGEAEETNDG